jgi:hypothetical protein
VKPFAEGGSATLDNIELRCRAHNQYEADLIFGETFTLREPVSVMRYDRTPSGGS